MISVNSKYNVEYEYSGLFKSQDEWIHPRRVISTYEIIFMIEGQGYICEEDRRFEIKSGNFLLLKPNKLHYGYEKSCEPVSFYWIHFNMTKGCMEDFPKYGSLPIPNSLKNLFVQLLHIANTPGYSKECCDLITALIIEEIRRQSGGSSGEIRQLAVQIKEWIRINISDAPTVKKVSEKFGYHENYIGKIFRDAYGMGLKRYINNMRVENIKGYLGSAGYTVKQIAHLCGFESENICIKFFKYHTGMTPTEYKNIYSNTHINKR